MAIEDQVSSGGVRLEHITKRFGRHVAVSDVSVEVGQGETLVLLGPSGCGKTTLLRTIAGLESPDEGTVMFGGRDFTHVPTRKRRTAMVFQSYALFPHMTVFDNVAYGLRNRGVSHQDIERRVSEGLALVDLGEMRDRYPGKLSGGQQQRVAIARSLVVEPAILLLDEPFGALDLKLRRRLQFELRQILERIDVSVLHVTHDQEEALTLADRIGVMQTGHLLQVGTPREVYDAAQNAFVASFLGDANLLPVEEGGKVIVGDQRVTAFLTGGGELACLRPEALTIKSNSVEGDLAGTITSAVFLGDATVYEVTVDTACLRVRQSAGQGNFAPGSQISLDLPSPVWTVQR